MARRPYRDPATGRFARRPNARRGLDGRFERSPYASAPLTMSGAAYVTGDGLQVLNDIADRIADPRVFFGTTLRSAVSDFFEKQFDTQGSHGGERWAPNRPLTQALKRRPGHGLGGPGKVLVDTDTLRRAYVNAGAAHSHEVVEVDRYERGVTDLAYAAIHAEGFVSRTIFGRKRKRPVRIPRRSAVPQQMPQWLVNTWGAQLAEYIGAN